MPIGRTSFTQVYELFSTAHNVVSAVGEGIIVRVDKKSGKPVPDEIRKAIETVEALQRAAGA